MESRYVLNLRRQVVHLAVWDGDQLLSDERCLLARMKQREVIEADPDAERLAGFMGRGYRLCARCFPEEDRRSGKWIGLLAEGHTGRQWGGPEAALMDAAARESEP